MSQKVTATEAARNFSEILNRVRYGRETFVIVRGGEAVGQLSPVESGKAPTLRELIEILQSCKTHDEQFARDLEDIQASQPPMGSSPWDS